MRLEKLQEFAICDPSDPWQAGQSKSVTFIVTEDCQLCCGYCYLSGKNSMNKMTFGIARRTIDYVLRERGLFDEASVVWDFIGGEPLLEIDLIDKICDYIKLRMYELDHPWFNSYRFNFSTNGLSYGDEKVQRYIKKNLRHLSVTISIDGTKEKHDAQRVFPDGRGSYDDIVKNIPLWLRQFPNANTKATVSHEDLPYLKDSVVHLWELGIKNIAINAINEDVWKPGDDLLFEDQLMQLADHIIDHELYITHNCSFFSKSIGEPINIKDDINWCGTGKMLAVDGDGTFYPCVRFAQYSLQNKPARIIGNCFDGIDTNRLRPFPALTRTSQSPEKCLECEVASGCAWCPGYNYDAAETDTIFQRAIYTCDMHKARVRANRYFWDKLQSKLDSRSGEIPSRGLKYV
jgi:uncharacterized protein